MALKGIRVLELAGLAPAPFCGMILSDFGATVTIVDRIPSTPNVPLTEGKQSVQIDMKHPKGQTVIRQLIKQTDILIDPYRPGVLERLQLGPTELLAANPKLIMARLTGFGQTGPFAQKAGHDINYVATSGILSYLGRKTEKPTAPINLMADFGAGGFLCAFGICAALHERHESGKGQIIDLSMTEGTSYLGSWLTRSQKSLNWSQERGTNLLDSGRFFYDTYETKDGRFMSVGALEPKFYKDLIRGLGLRGIEQYEDNDDSVELITKLFKTRTQQEWMEIFEPLDACVFPVLDSESVVEHPQNAFRNSFVDRSVTNGMVVPNPAPILSRTPATSGYVRPISDDENRTNVKEMLHAAGIDDKQLADLQTENILNI